MAKDLQDHVRDIVSHAAHEAAKSFDGNSRSKSGGALSGGKGIAAGAGAVALAPLAVKGVGKLVEAAGVNGIATAPSKAVEGLSSTVQDKLSAGVGDKISEKVEEVGGPGGALKEAVKSALPL